MSNPLRAIAYIIDEVWGIAGWVVAFALIAIIGVAIDSKARAPKPVRYVVATCPTTGFDVQRPIDPMWISPTSTRFADTYERALVRCVQTSTSASYLPAPLRHLDPTTRGVVERRYTDGKIGARQVRIVVEEVEP